MLVNPPSLRRRCLVILLAALGVVIPALADDVAQPLDLVPEDTLLCWYGRPFPDTHQAASQPGTLQSLLDLASRLSGRSLESSAQMFMRGAEMFSLLVRYPHAIALIDVQTKSMPATPDVKRVDQLRLAVIVQSGVQSDAFYRLIQKTVNEHTDASTATLTMRRAGSLAYQELRDRRTADWCAIAWGQIGGCFVLTIGPDVWPLVASIAAGQKPSLARQPWFADARRRVADEPTIEIFAEIGDIVRRLDPLVAGRASEFFDIWGAGTVKRTYWAMGLIDRALFCRAEFLTGDQTVSRIYADSGTRGDDLLRVVPPGSRYAVYELPMDRFLEQLVRAMMVLQGPKERANIEQIWARLQETGGFDARRGLLANLGHRVVLHNYPVHPLRLPLAVTALIEIREHPEQVRQTLDKLCESLEDELEKAAAEGRGPPPWRFARESDGLWYVQYGPVAGPACVVTDHFVILSWSPRALREYLAKLESSSTTTQAGGDNHRPAP